MISAKGILCGALVLMAGWCVAVAAADPAEQSDQDAQRAVRLKLLRQLAEKWQVSVLVDGNPTPVKMLSEPLYRYSRPSQDTPEAVVWAWGDRGRPVALVTLYCYVRPGGKSLTHELDSLSPHPLVCKLDGQERWTPKVGLDMKPLPGAPAPATDPPGRLRQIKALTARMKADQVPYRSPAGDASNLVNLPWLAQPVYRYSDPAHGITDGAICFACTETDPEVLLVIEAQRRGDSPSAWYCGFNRVTACEVHVRFDDKVLWTAPRVETTQTSATDAYHLLFERLGP